MSQEILINVTPRETRVAVVENGVLQEIYIERACRRGLVGNIYKASVSRILPGMQAAFLNVGLVRTAFLHASDITCPATPHESGSVPVADITDLLKEQQHVLVQVIKDPIGTKGARLTTHITIPSRLMVLLPDNPTVGISARIEEEAERARLRRIGEAFVAAGEGCGYILRTAAEGATEEALRCDRDFLGKLWKSIQVRSDLAQPETLIHGDLPLALRALRDLITEGIAKVWVDSWETYQKVQVFCEQFLPDIAELIEHYQGERPIFDLYGVEDEIQRALERQTQLKSGGYLIIDQTEAMTTIDVNTGGYVGHRTLEETIFKTNLEAAQAIARQLRLRNLGGIIIIDFIDMEEEDHRRQVLRALEKALERDHVKTQISGVSALGLVEMTRKRTRESLERVLCEPCRTCAGRGSLKTAETVCYEIAREILREARQFDVQKLLVLTSQEVVDLILDQESDTLAELESFIGKPIEFQAEPLYTQEQFDVVLM
ncbi:ribonuclease G [Nitrococcus mobilis]|uniref:Ribonuclease G n=1 Tax=Nitrococcus mobilis Nb-231 TaxID=314278 RepID=A4BQN2_9GAMM|nr:Ribonuclease E and G [Nitrococcus mobilis Nb-231]